MFFSKKKNKIKGIIDKILMGAVIGGAIGSVIGASIKNNLNNEEKKEEPKKGMIRKIIGIFFKKKNKENSEIKKIPNEMEQYK
ncbi:MAG: hypothetical protein WC806_00805 [Candidatus Gracilibacteria bacterium]|jgi:hypothetical protein